MSNDFIGSIDGPAHLAVVQENERLRQRVKELGAALRSAQEHLEWCGYGDSYESECARNQGLPELIEKALEADK